MATPGPPPPLSMTAPVAPPSPGAAAPPLKSTPLQQLPAYQPQPQPQPQAPPPPPAATGLAPPGVDADPHIQEAFSYVAGAGAGAHEFAPPHVPPAPPYAGLYAPQAAHAGGWAGWLAGHASPADVQLAFLVMAMYMAVETVPVADMTYRFWPAVFERVPYSDVVIKAAMLGVAVLVVKRALAPPGP